MMLTRVVYAALLVLIAVEPAGAKTRPEGTVDRLTRTPTFFEMHSKAHGDDANLMLFREGKVRLYPLGVHNIENFNWKTHSRKDQSWWIRIERFEYMCPIFDSRSDLDRDLAKSWVTNWLNVHEKEKHPNPGSHDAMGVGMRAMMLARYLRYLRLEEPEEKEMIARLVKVIQWHQDFLAQPSNFNRTSNHGLWESMGLFETTRVAPDTTRTLMALRRFMEVVRLGVSAQGIEKEHAVGYHYYFSTWLSQFSEYLQSLDRLQWQGLPALVDAAKRMERATWYMYDHTGRMPQIGDTDDMPFTNPPRVPRKIDPVMFDSEAGYAVYKDPDKARLRRYVVFCIQNQGHRITMPYHIHNDMMAVYYSDDGEIILGDGGRYSYANSPIRRFYLSSASHNVILPDKFLKAFNTSKFLARDVWQERSKKDVTFGLSLPNKMVNRAVNLPFKKRELRVHDTINVQEKHTVLWNLGADVTSLGPGGMREENGGRVYSFDLRTKRGRRFTMKVSVWGGNKAAPEVEIVKGREQPMLGWYSPDYNVSWPVPVVCVNVDPEDTVEVLTEVIGH